MPTEKPIEAQIGDIISPSIRAMGFELVRVKLSSGGRSVLQIMAERQDGVGITLDDCATISRTVSALLDVADPIPEGYSLEVSSPGLDRPLTRLEDFRRFAGSKVKVALSDPLEGRKKFKGMLEGVKENIIYLVIEEETASATVAIPFADIASARLAIADDVKP